LLRQFSVMIDARVDAVQAFSALRASAGTAHLQTSLEQAATMLRSGETLGQCLQAGIPGIPVHTLALINAGEAGGCLAETCIHAVEQLEAEERIAAALRGALTYPAFLIAAGLAASILMLTFVIPRFADILGDRRESLEGTSWLIFKLGDLAGATMGMAFLIPVLLVTALVVRSWRRGSLLPRGTGRSRLPVVATLQADRDRERWCRLMAFSLSAHLPMIDAFATATAALSDPQFRDRSQEAVRAIRRGMRIADAIATMHFLDDAQLSLIRVGEESNRLPEMFNRIAQDAEAALQESLKRVTLVLEQAVIIAVSCFIGMLVFALISSLTSIYEAIGQ
jgi:general secretion pathway protein F